MQSSFIEEEEDEEEEFKYLLQTMVLLIIDGVWGKKSAIPDKDQFTLFELLMPLIFHKGAFQNTT